MSTTRNAPKSRECSGGTLVEESSVEDHIYFDTDMPFKAWVVQFIFAFLIFWSGTYIPNL